MSELVFRRYLEVLFLLPKRRQFVESARSKHVQNAAEALSADEFALCADCESDHFGAHSLDFELGVAVGQSRVSFVAEARVELISILSFAVLGHPAEKNLKNRILANFIKICQKMKN